MVNAPMFEVRQLVADCFIAAVPHPPTLRVGHAARDNNRTTTSYEVGNDVTFEEASCPIDSYKSRVFK